MNFRLDHIAIQTDNYDNTVQWYKEYFNCVEKWYRTWEQLPGPIQKRMPRATKIVELQVDDIRFHIFDIKKEQQDVSDTTLQYQHFGVEVETMDELVQMRNRWIHLYRSGNHQYKRTDLPTDFIPSSDGMSCFYAFDPNGLEFEVIYLP